MDLIVKESEDYMSSKHFTSFYESMERCPIIAAINNDSLLEACKTAPCEIVYILYGNICTIADIVDEVVAAGKRGNELELITIQRFFMLDRLTYNNIKKHVRETSPDIVEMMPAGLTKMITYALEEINGKPLVVSGLVLDKSDVMGALSAGAIAISTTNEEIWATLD